MRKIWYFLLSLSLSAFFVGIGMKWLIADIAENPTKKVEVPVPNLAFDVWSIKRANLDAWEKKNSQWHSSAEYAMLSYIQWQRDVLAGRSKFDACSDDASGELAKWLKKEEKQESACALQRTYEGIRLKWLAKSGLDHGRVDDILNETIGAKPVAGWWSSPAGYCTPQSCGFNGEPAFLNDRTLAGKILEGDASVLTILPADEERIGVRPPDPGEKPSKTLAHMLVVQRSPLPAWASLGVASRLVRNSVILTAILLSIAVLRSLWARVAVFRRREVDVESGSMPYRSRLTKCTCRCGYEHLKAQP